LQGSVAAPPRELKAFRKVTLEPGESAVLTFELSREELGHYSAAMDAWVYDGGPSTVYVGASSRDLRLSASVDVPAHRVARPLTVWSTFGEWQNDPEASARLARLIDDRGGIRGRMADLLDDETGRASVLGFPLRALVEFPGFPVELDDVDMLLSGTARPAT
jgi:beta-glucosidase